MSIRSALTRCLLAAVILLATACTQPSTPPSPPVAPPAQPTLSPSSPAAQGCNRRASLRPRGSLPAPGAMPAGSAMARIANRGYLVAGVNQDTQAFSFRDDNLRLQGFDVDIVRDIAEAIFGDRERVVYRQLNIADRLTAARSGEVDLVVATVSITCQRRDQVDFSNVYLETGQRVLVNRGSGFADLAGLAGHRVCSSRGATGWATLQAAIPKLIPVGVSATTDCLALMQLGQVDAVCADDTTLASMAVQDSRTEIVGPRITEESYGVAIRKDTPELVRFVNAVLERRAADGRWRAGYEHWLTLLGPPPSPPAPQYQD
ncbi:MAG TPA: glutamate ABC transporter substrate-binding protein [Pseudonocardiaceae bacterium]|nr:glutamate ABC transporter substrate-binding protein [Pseudonocardiaceae bacterium]